MRQRSRSFRWVMGVAALTVGASFAAQADPRERDTDLRDAKDITLFQSNERVLVMTRIADGDLVPMVFDTGSDGTTIDRSLARRLRLRKAGQVEEVDGTTGKKRILPLVALRNVTLGGHKVDAIEAASVDYDRNDAMGIISSELFTDNLLYLDLAENRAVLAPRASTRPPDGPATDYVAGIPTAYITMPDGSSVPAHFDTGFNGALSLPVAMMNTVPLVGAAKVVGRFKSINTEGEVYGGQIRGKVTIGPVTLESPEVTFLGDLANIGLPIIRRITLVIDAAADRNWVLPSGAIAQAAR